MSSPMPNVATGTFGLQQLFGVRGRIVVVTGGGSGLGAYAAIALALHGAKVYVVGRRKEKLDAVAEDFAKRKTDNDAPVEARDGRVIALQGDVSSKEAIQSLLDTFAQHEQYLDVLVNGAGILRSPTKRVDKNDGEKVVESLWEQEWSHFTESFDVNVTGVHFATLGFVRFLSKAPKASLTHPGPVVLNVASIAGLHVTRNAPVPYQTSKDAVIKLSSILAGRLIPLRIRVNCISPGVYPSEMTGAASQESFDDPAHPFNAMVRANPLGRSGSPEDWAGLLLFLSSRAGAYLNSANIVTDGGRLITLSAA